MSRSIFDILIMMWMWFLSDETHDSFKAATRLIYNKIESSDEECIKNIMTWAMSYYDVNILSWLWKSENILIITYELIVNALIKHIQKLSAAESSLMRVHLTQTVIFKINDEERMFDMKILLASDKLKKQ